MVIKSSGLYPESLGVKSIIGKKKQYFYCIFVYWKLDCLTICILFWRWSDGATTERLRCSIVVPFFKKEKETQTTLQISYMWMGRPLWVPLYGTAQSPQVFINQNGNISCVTFAQLRKSPWQYSSEEVKKRSFHQQIRHSARNFQIETRTWLQWGK